MFHTIIVSMVRMLHNPLMFFSTPLLLKYTYIDEILNSNITFFCQCVFTPLEVMSAIFAAAIHDVDHPGQSCNKDSLKTIGEGSAAL